MLGLFLPGAELMLHCEVYGAEGSERAILVEALDKLDPADTHPVTHNAYLATVPDASKADNLLSLPFF